MASPEIIECDTGNCGGGGHGGSRCNWRISADYAKWRRFCKYSRKLASVRRGWRKSGTSQHAVFGIFYASSFSEVSFKSEFRLARVQAAG
jgi:hypothetical protein